MRWEGNRESDNVEDRRSDGGGGGRLTDDVGDPSSDLVHGQAGVHEFEVAVECFKGADDPKDRDDVANQLQNLKYTGISGELDFSSGPERGVAIQRCAGIQWRPGTDFEWDLVVVDNKTRPDIPIGGDLEPTNA